MRWSAAHRVRVGNIAAGLLSAMLLVSPAIGHAEPPVTEPTGYRMNDYRSPVPPTLAGARVVALEGAKALHETKSAVFIDVYPRAPKPPNLPASTVWRDPPHESLPGAVWLANTGYGVLPPAVEEYFATRLATLTGNDKAKAVVFFCLRDCWMSWNAGKRAMALGYSNVVWFPDGVDAWKEADLPIALIEPLP
jgi:PQQ-dependent catabolism-associated CXXCW motif protein